MLVDASRAPIVRLRSELASDLSLEQQFEALVGAGRTFVLITDHAPGDRHEETAEERKTRTLFFKGISRDTPAYPSNLLRHLTPPRRPFDWPKSSLV